MTSPGQCCVRAHEEYVRLNVSYVARGRSAAAQAGQTHRRKTSFGEIGLPEKVEKISSWAAVPFVPAFHASSSRSAASGKGRVRRLAADFGLSNTPS